MDRMSPHEVARKCADLAAGMKAREIRILNLKPLTSMADYFVICHGDADIHIRSIADAVSLGMKESGERVWHREGYNELNWVLLDFVDVVVHVFSEKSRNFYALERLWGDAEVERIGDENG